MTYEEYKEKRQNECNALPLFFAFSDEQFKEAMEERGLKVTDTDKIYRLGDCGGFYLKSDAEKVRAWLTAEDELPNLMKDKTFAEDAFYYEMCNHEYAINWQGAYDVCSCFGACEYGEMKTGDDYLKEMGYGTETRRAYQSALARYNKDAIDNEWF